MSKGSKQRPGTGYAKGWESIFGPVPKEICGLCRKPIDQCGCCPTEDGPGQDNESRKDEK